MFSEKSKKEKNKGDLRKKKKSEKSFKKIIKRKG